VSKDDTYKDLCLFDNTFELWKAINNDIKPKEFSYQLKHKK